MFARWPRRRNRFYRPRPRIHFRGVRLWTNGILGCTLAPQCRGTRHRRQRVGEGGKIRHRANICPGRQASLAAASPCIISTFKQIVRSVCTIPSVHCSHLPPSPSPIYHPRRVHADKVGLIADAICFGLCDNDRHIGSVSGRTFLGLQ